MVTYDKAYSKELKLDLSAEKANEYYIGKTKYGNSIPKQIKTRNEFQCSYNCILQLTCANISIDFSNDANKNKLDPYFTNRNGGMHNNACSRVITYRKTYEKTSEKTSIYIRNGNNLVIDFKKDFGGLLSKSSTQSNGIQTTGILPSTSHNNSKNNRSQTRTPHTKDINKLIEMFEEYEVGNFSLNLFDADNNPISFEDIFIPISGSEIKNEYFIYYGQAYVERIKNNLKLSFSGTTKLDSFTKLAKPSILLFENHFKENRKSSLFSIFNDYSIKFEQAKKDKNFTKKNYFRLYFVGKFVQKGDFINFDTESSVLSKSLFIQKN